MVMAWSMRPWESARPPEKVGRGSDSQDRMDRAPPWQRRVDEKSTRGKLSALPSESPLPATPWDVSQAGQHSGRLVRKALGCGGLGAPKPGRIPSIPAQAVRVNDVATPPRFLAAIGAAVVSGIGRSIGQGVCVIHNGWYQSLRLRWPRRAQTWPYTVDSSADGASQ